MSQYDLTQKMIPYLDRHLAYPLLKFLSIKEMYAQADLQQAIYELFSKTNMIDFTADLYKQINNTEDSTEKFAEQRTQVLSKLEELQTEAQKVMSVIEKPEVIQALKQDKLQNIQYLKENFGFDPESINILYQYGKFQFDCGNYGTAADMLYHFRVLSTDQNLILNAMWGKLASEILAGNFTAAYQDIMKLRELIDSTSYENQLHQLQQRTWLLHWTLFVFFNYPKGKDGLIDMFLHPQYINTIQTSCPWILRYVTAAVVTNRRRKNTIKDLVKAIQQEAYNYRDPMTDFLLALYVEFDFDGAQSKLKQCEELMSQDFFLISSLEKFVENARIFILEAFCRIHQRINIATLSERLNMTQEEGEKWIVNLMRDNRVDAKINFSDNTVVMNPVTTSVTSQLIDKTKEISIHSQFMVNGLDKREQALAAAKAISNQAQPPSTSSA
ncbi:eukaryotic translation initiation factor 3, subunit E [Conidiobolus coronatus NRRL 28638]|uniref:Eukaryotic translation initiation factor 3 subunit E n=1 Tax=Conidiobolus coronatus (strain ATCC 28846 / CBS 209.66 / NRRL 28638) TaxID=796925 RepID=A0A137NWV7_CONC2|nr:eukaryotic translation initiation factor 3, subunit E [Conidiobolus coronatus NRRL 28638]|eukprot:KXN67320.1 eukaryotic translation initiation factor 3, subunit E [Conidiobolus coronatus NRRL 28638]